MAEIKQPHGGTDRWNAARQRLEMVAARLASADTFDQRAIDEVYRRRARQLAERKVAETDSVTLPLLVVGLGTERYGIDLSELAEVFPFRDCTPIPGSAPALLGVINVRGDIRSVVDLRRVLDLPPADGNAPGYVVMLRQQDGTIGFRVDTVDEVRQVDPARLIRAGDGVQTFSGSPFVKALTADTVILIDTGAALSSLVRAVT